MSHAEWVQWLKYRQRHGPLGPERLYDRPGALVAHVLRLVNGGRGKMKDFQIWPRATAEEQEMEDIVAELMGGSD